MSEPRYSVTKPPRVLLDGLAYVESPRWHEGRLWFAHWGTGEVVAVDLDGRSEVVAQGPSGLGWSIDWLPDGRLLVTGPNSCGRSGTARWFRMPISVLWPTTAGTR